MGRDSLGVRPRFQIILKETVVEMIGCFSGEWVAQIVCSLCSGEGLQGDSGSDVFSLLLNGKLADDTYTDPNIPTSWLSVPCVTVGRDTCSQHQVQKPGLPTSLDPLQGASSRCRPQGGEDGRATDKHQHLHLIACFPTF